MILHASNLHKSFTFPSAVSILEGIDLELEKQEAIAIMGASGEGKTTLLHILGSLETYEEGDIFLNGISFKEQKSLSKMRNAHFGFVFQSCNLLEDLTAIENVLLPARIQRKKTSVSSNSYERALYLLEEVGLEKRKDFPCKLLSGGEKQRVAIARALMNDPSILLADEPSGNLDHDTSDAIHSLLLNCVKKMGKSLIVVTHDKDLANLCDKIYLLKRGKLFLQ